MKEHRKVATFVLIAATVAIVLVGALVSNIHIIQKANGQIPPTCRDCTKITCEHVTGGQFKCTTVPLQNPNQPNTNQPNTNQPNTNQPNSIHQGK